MKVQLPVFYDCDRCPAYCCTYARIVVEPSDIRRLAKRFGITAAQARKRFTKPGEERGERVLRHRHDTIFQTACRFLDPDTRRCTVYEDRPEICRDFPGSTRCGYYDFLAFERRAQEDPDLVVSAWVADT
ncbi:MAG: YkgJ family cysteine cluster protein [Longimicrobiales bacterium]